MDCILLNVLTIGMIYLIMNARLDAQYSPTCAGYMVETFVEDTYYQDDMYGYDENQNDQYGYMILLKKKIITLKKRLYIHY